MGTTAATAPAEQPARSLGSFDSPSEVFPEGFGFRVFVKHPFGLGFNVGVIFVELRFSPAAASSVPPESP